MGWFDNWFNSRPPQRLGPNDLPEDVLQDLLQDNASEMPSKNHSKSHSQYGFPSEGNFEEMYNELSYMFENFMGSQPSFTIKFGDPEELNSRKPKNLRDKMLDGDKNNEKAIIPFHDESEISKHSAFGFIPHSIFRGFFHIPFDKRITEDHDRLGCDVDLDDDVNNGTHSLDDILKDGPSSSGILKDDDSFLNDNPSSPYAGRSMIPNDLFDLDKFIPHQQSDFQSVYKYSTITKKMNPDGSIETHSKKRDSDGNEETVITRSIGDKSHTVSTRKDQDGQEETTEKFVNMEQDELSNFEERWKDNKPALRDRLLTPADKPPSDNWQDIFSSWWKPKL